jgi:hypothetical protein
VIAATTEAAAITAAAVERIETFFAETAVPLVPAPAATSSIETHKPELTFASPPWIRPGGADETRRTTGQAAAACTRPSPLHPRA